MVPIFYIEINSIVLYKVRYNSIYLNYLFLSVYIYITYTLELPDHSLVIFEAQIEHICISIWLLEQQDQLQLVSGLLQGCCHLYFSFVLFVILYK